MGGNALAPFGARRYERAEYLELSEKVLEVLYPVVPDERAVEIPSYKNKQSFGDMDILVLNPWAPQNYNLVQEAFDEYNGKASPSCRNGEVLSIMFEELQVDIIPMPEMYFDTAHMYYSYNDLGNLMGKLFHKFGLKYGHRGLTLPLRDGDHMFEEVPVSQDGYEIFGFLGLSYKRFCQGFDELEDIFKFVMSSPYFSTEPFQYENLNHTNRIRDKKRSTYHAFLEYIKDEPCRYDYHRDKDAYLDGIFDHFPGVEEKCKEAQARLEHAKAVKEHFNGELVSEWTGLTGHRLGKFMYTLRSDRGHFSKWVLSYTQEALKTIVMELLEDFLKFERMSSLITYART